MDEKREMVYKGHNVTSDLETVQSVLVLRMQPSRFSVGNVAIFDEDSVHEMRIWPGLFC